MLKTHDFNLEFYKNGFFSKKKVKNVSYFDNHTVNALLTMPIKSELTNELVYGDMYYMKERQELAIFGFHFENMNISGYGFHLISKECAKREYISGNFVKFITFNNFFNDFSFSKNNSIYIGNIFIDAELLLQINILSAFKDIEAIKFKYSIVKTFSMMLDFYDKETVCYRFESNGVVKEFNICMNIYQASKDLFLITKKQNIPFSLPLTFLYFDKDYGEMEYITCQSGDIIIPDNYEKFEDLFVSLNKEGYTSLNLLSSINESEFLLKKNFYIRRNGYQVISLNDKSKYLKFMLKYL